ncbi:4Fe-4S dicluster domain-containing protein [Geobacter sp. FeAm09]|uniref:4Fe-4S dicluster domain-containing protein n=1 Tax=Geobacter sp. FeAm09 TaxID=2597769 RepID=UPI0011F00B9D|nr:4Fe-4S dicluster domain-containing protein [Geobacter sp. FeAm09]QEM67675.1 4Fe-4S dicluster domain-containing protein [Geobacter sp. FeAm09]
MEQKGFYLDQTRCAACDTCLVACKGWNGIKPGPAFWRKRIETEVGGYPNLVIYQLPMSCNHCANPACIAVCPMGTIYKREEDGVVIVNRDGCIGCKACQAACPFGAPQFADDTQEPAKQSSWRIDHPMQKCTACWDRTAANKKPACVASCPTRALDFDTIDNLKATYPSATTSAVGLPNTSHNAAGTALEKDTLPSILFKRK